MRLCVDEDLRSAELLNRRRKGGHEIIRIENGLTDQAVWDLAQRHDAAVLTRNAGDFIGLAQFPGHHAGLLLVLAEGDATRDMKPGAVARAIGRVDERYASLGDLIVVVNQHRS
ncbi:MAG: DUF5615 family PIN-like protein [Candidatus Limnocylindria bacterium]